MAEKSTDDYPNLEDKLLVDLSRRGDTRAERELFARYQNLIQNKANRYFLPGGERQDVIQEGRIGLHKAIKSYDPTFGTSFKSFARLCIVRQIITAIKAANREKRDILNSSVSLNKPVYTQSEQTLLERLQNEDRTDNPGQILVDREKLTRLASLIRKKSTDLEYSVFREFTKDKSYREIADSLQIHTKAVDNALQRFRSKVKKILAEEVDYFRQSSL